MGDYITIYYGSSTAAPKAPEWDNAMIVADGSPALSESKVYVLTPDDYQTQLTDDGFTTDDMIYKSCVEYFAASPTPQKLHVYAHVSGQTTTYEDVPLEYVSGYIWETPIKPVSGFKDDLEAVKFYGCGENISDSGILNIADGSSGIGFTVDKDGAGNWTGRLEFTNGLSGINGVVKPLTSTCKVTASFTAGTESGLGDAIDQYNINLICLSLENNSTIEQYTDNVFGSQLDDLMTMVNTIAGKNCQFIYALPGGADPETTISGTSNKWKELKSLIGARKDVSAIKVIPSTLTNDPAAGYMAMIVVSHPHKQMTFAEPHFGVGKAEPKINMAKWKDGQIACLMKQTRLSGNPYLVTYGFTFGSGDESRIDGVRCRYIMAQSLINNLWGLLAKRETLMSYDGMQKIKKCIEGTFNTLINQKIVDKLIDINIPIEEDLKNNTAAGRLARAQMTVPSIEITYEWYPSVEKIIITSVDNVAT